MPVFDVKHPWVALAAVVPRGLPAGYSSWVQVVRSVSGGNGSTRQRLGTASGLSSRKGLFAALGLSEAGSVMVEEVN